MFVQSFSIDGKLDFKNGFVGSAYEMVGSAVK